VKLPLLDNVNGRHSDSAGNEAVSAGHCNGLEGALDSVKDVVQNAGAELHRKRLQEARYEINSMLGNKMIPDGFRPSACQLTLQILSHFKMMACAHAHILMHGVMGIYLSPFVMTPRLTDLLSALDHVPHAKPSSFLIHLWRPFRQ